MRALLVPCVLLAACVNNNDDPISYVTGLRVLAIEAEPPDITVGEQTTLTALALDTDGTPVTLTWAACTDPPTDSDTINPDCVTTTDTSFLLDEGTGLSVSATMPDVPLTSLGLPDASDGLYVPEIVHATAGSATLAATYRLRRNVGLTPNQNPVFTGLFTVAADGSLTAVTDGLVVHDGDELTLRAAFASGSAESYLVANGSPPVSRTFTETLSVSWFATSGSFGHATSGVDVPDETLTLDSKDHLPNSGDPIDLWAVGRDERGGTTWLHAALSFE